MQFSMWRLTGIEQSKIQMREKVLKSKIQKFIRMYGYMSQIIDFVDIELEKSYNYLMYLNRKLPKRDAERFDLSDYVDLESLRIQISQEQIRELIDESHVDSPPEFEEMDWSEPARDTLAEIVKQVNERYGLNLTEDDRLNLERVEKGLSEDVNIRLYMGRRTVSRENKTVFFREQFDNRVLELINDSIEFYKTLEDNPSAKNTIFQYMLARLSEATELIYSIGLLIK